MISLIKLPLTLRSFLEAPGGSGAADDLLLFSKLEPCKCYLSDLVMTLNFLNEEAEFPLLPKEAV